MNKNSNSSFFMYCPTELGSYVMVFCRDDSFPLNSDDAQLDIEHVVDQDINDSAFHKSFFLNL